MLARPPRTFSSHHVRRHGYSTTSPNLLLQRQQQQQRRHLKQWSPLPLLTDPSPTSFHETTAVPSSHPVQFPKAHFTHQLPAIQKWFSPASLPSRPSSSPSIPSSTSDPDDPPSTPANPTSIPNYAYLNQFASTTFLPLELTTNTTTTSPPTKTFHRTEAPLTLWLNWTNLILSPHQSTSTTPTTPTTTTTSPGQPQPQLYLAQAPLSSLPRTLQADLPTPTILHSSSSDNYTIQATSIWLGIAPTHTPLHRDPDANLFVQLAGRKKIRMVPPGVGERLFTAAAAAVNKEEEEGGSKEESSSSSLSPTSLSSSLEQARLIGNKGRIRGEEMMTSAQTAILESWIWDDDDGYTNPPPTTTTQVPQHQQQQQKVNHKFNPLINKTMMLQEEKKEEQEKGENFDGWEASLEAGDAVLIPRGWWHSVKGIDDVDVDVDGDVGKASRKGVTASANWWFRSKAKSS